MSEYIKNLKKGLESMSLEARRDYAHYITNKLMNGIWSEETSTSALYYRRSERRRLISRVFDQIYFAIYYSLEEDEYKVSDYIGKMKLICLSRF